MSNNTSAIASWLGYNAQEYRLVERLLKAKKSNVLGFEILDDVHEISDEKTILEQDKLSITSRNIVANKSQDVWKTLSNWVDLIKSNRVDASKTEFLLYTNKEHSSDILSLLCKASNVDEAKEAYDKIVKLVDKPSDNIKKYVDNFFSFDDKKYILIAHFQYAHGSGSAPQDLKKTYLDINTSINESSENILQEILGWTKDNLTLLAEKRQPTLISAEAFGKRLGEIESKYRQQTLLDFICSRAGGDVDVQSEITEQPAYIKQLDLVNIDDLGIENAVIAKLETKDAVSKWTIEGHIQEVSYSKYNDALERKWGLQKNITNIQNHQMNDENKGALLYYQCLQGATDIKIENKQVDDFFSHGSYQELANSQCVGWHPNYKTELKGVNNDS